MDVDHREEDGQESATSEVETKKPRGKATSRAMSPRKQTASRTSGTSAKDTVRKTMTPPIPKATSTRTRTIVADDSQEESEPVNQGDDEDEYQASVPPVRARSPRKQAHVILDSEDETSAANGQTPGEDEDEDFLIPKAGSRASGKARAKRYIFY
jgi:hypothetical protein